MRHILGEDMSSDKIWISFNTPIQLQQNISQFLIWLVTFVISKINQILENVYDYELITNKIAPLRNKTKDVKQTMIPISYTLHR